MQKRVNSVQKELTNQAFWFVNDQRNSHMANQIFCFKIKRMPWMARLVAQFFPDCVIRVRFFCLTISKFLYQNKRSIGHSGWKWMEQKISGKLFLEFWSTSRGCPFFPEIRKFREFCVPFYTSSRHESSLAPLAVTVASTNSRYRWRRWQPFDVSACFLTSHDVELLFQHDCVDNSGNATSPMGTSKTELDDFTLLMHTLLERVQISNSRHLCEWEWNDTCL